MRLFKGVVAALWLGFYGQCFGWPAAAQLLVSTVFIIFAFKATEEK